MPLLLLALLATVGGTYFINHHQVRAQKPPAETEPESEGDTASPFGDTGGGGGPYGEGGHVLGPVPTNEIKGSPAPELPSISALDPPPPAFDNAAFEAAEARIAAAEAAEAAAAAKQAEADAAAAAATPQPPVIVGEAAQPAGPTPPHVIGTKPQENTPGEQTPKERRPMKGWK